MTLSPSTPLTPTLTPVTPAHAVLAPSVQPRPAITPPTPPIPFPEPHTPTIFEQPESEWVIQAAPGAYPIVTVIDVNGDVVEGDVSYEEDGTVRILFSEPVSGRVVLS